MLDYIINQSCGENVLWTLFMLDKLTGTEKLIELKTP